MKNLLHFAKLTKVQPVEVNKPVDSGNGFYSYSYYVLPYSGKADQESLCRISSIIFKRFYNPPFMSLGSVEILRENLFGGEILFQLTYHHGD